MLRVETSDGIEVYVLPEDSKCLADERKQCPLNLMECPLGKEVCNTDCYYYAEGE